MSTINPTITDEMIERATLALVNSRRELHGLSPIDRMPWAHTSDMERRHVAAALEAAAPLIAAQACSDGRREVFDALRMFRDEADKPLAVDLGNMVRAWLDEREGCTHLYRSDLEQADQP